MRDAGFGWEVAYSAASLVYAIPLVILGYAMIVGRYSVISEDWFAGMVLGMIATHMMVNASGMLAKRRGWFE